MGAQPGIDKAELGGALTGQALGQSLFGDTEGLFALWHFVEDFQEMIHSIHHLVVLCDDMRKEELFLILIARLHIGSKGIVGQAASLTHLLEDDGVHATTIVFIEQSLHGSLFGIPFTLFVMDHAHVDVLGIVRSDEDLVFRCGLHLVVLALRDSLQLGHSLMVFSDSLGHLFCSHGAVIQHGVLIVLEVLQEVEQFLRVKLTDLIR